MATKKWEWLTPEKFAEQAEKEKKKEKEQAGELLKTVAPQTPEKVEQWVKTETEAKKPVSEPKATAPKTKQAAPKLVVPKTAFSPQMQGKIEEWERDGEVKDGARETFATKKAAEQKYTGAVTKLGEDEKNFEWPKIPETGADKYKKFDDNINRVKVDNYKKYLSGDRDEDKKQITGKDLLSDETKQFISSRVGDPEKAMETTLTKGEDLTWVQRRIDESGSKSWDEYLTMVTEEDVKEFEGVDLNTFGFLGRSFVLDLREAARVNGAQRDASEAAQTLAGVDEAENFYITKIANAREQELRGVKPEDYVYVPKVIDDEDEEFAQYLTELYAKAEAEALRRVYSDEELKIAAENIRSNDRKASTARMALWFADKLGGSKGEEMRQRVEDKLGDAANNVNSKDSTATAIHQARELNWADRVNNVRQNADFEEQSKLTDEDKLSVWMEYDVNPQHYGVNPAGLNEKQKFVSVKLDIPTHYAKLLTDEEVSNLIYITHTMGEEDGKAYYKTLTNDVKARNTAEHVAEEKKFAEKHPYWASVKERTVDAVGSGVLNAMYAASDMFGGIVGKEYAPIDINDERFFHDRDLEITQAITDQKHKNPVIREAYNVGMSIAENAFRTISVVGTGMLIGGPAGAAGAKVSLALMASNAYQSGVYDVLKRGGSTEAAMAYGAVSAVVELVTEKISIEKFLDVLDDIAKHGGKTMLKDIAKQAGAEGVEELIAAIAEPIYDDMIMGEKSHFNMRIKELESEGMNHNEARKQTLQEELIQIGMSSFAGAVSGGVMAGGAVAIDSGVNAVKDYKKTEAEIRDIKARTDVLGKKFDERVAELVKSGVDRKTAGRQAGIEVYLKNTSEESGNGGVVTDGKKAEGNTPVETSGESTRREVQGEIDRLQQVQEAEPAEAIPPSADADTSLYTREASADDALKAKIPTAKIMTADEAVKAVEAELKEINNEKPKGRGAITKRTKEIWKEMQEETEQKLSDVKFIKALMNAGINVRFFSAAETADGTVAPDSATVGSDIYININGANPVKKTLGREFVHVLKDISPEAYGNFAEVVREQFDTRFAHELETYYEDTYEAFGENAMFEEFAADVAGDMLMSPGYSQSLIDAIMQGEEAVEVKKSKIKAVAEAVRNVIVKLNAALKKMIDISEHGTALKYINDAKAVHQALVKAYNEVDIKKATSKEVGNAPAVASGESEAVTSPLKRGTDIVINRLSEGEWSNEHDDVYNKAVGDLEAMKARTEDEGSRNEIQSEIDRLQQVRTERTADTISPSADADTSLYTREASADDALKAKIPTAKIMTADEAVKTAEAELRAINAAKPDEGGMFKDATNSKRQDWKEKQKAAKQKLSDIRLVKALADEGFHVKFFSAAEAMSEDGTGVADGATVGTDIYININGVDPVKKTLGHEFIHVLKNTSAEAYDNFAKVVEKQFDKRFAREVEADYESRYKDKYKSFDEEAKFEEFAADVAGDMLINPEYSRSLIDAIMQGEEAVEVKKSKIKAVAEAVRSVIVKLNTAIRKLRGTYEQGQALRYINDAKVVHQALVKAYQEVDIKKATSKEVDNFRYSVEEKSQKITAEMSDEERAEILRKKNIKVVSFDANKSETLKEIDFNTLQKSYVKDARDIAKKIAEEFGVFKIYSNPDIELEFEYSRGSLKESLNKQQTTYGDFVKMLSVFPDVVNNAVGIEIHGDKYKGTRREDADLKQAFVLASAFNEGVDVVPIKLEVKEFEVKTNKLHLSVVMTKKESRDLSGNPWKNQTYTTPPTFTISISDLVSIVNPSEGDFLKYFPDSMLDDEQIEGKQEALERDEVKKEKIKFSMPLGNKTTTEQDAEYLEAVERGDMETAQRMVDAAAKNAGYNSPKLYHGTNSFGFTAFDLSKMDDKSTIFLTSNPKIASTYSGVSGERKISDVYNKDIESLPLEDVAEELNKFVKEYYKDTFEAADYNYSYYNLEKLNKLIDVVNGGLAELKVEVEQKIVEYADKMALDFDDKTAKAHRQLVSLKEKLDKWDYHNLSTPIYLLIHHTDVFKENGAKYADLEANIRLMNMLRTAQDITEGVVVEESLGRYSIELMNRADAVLKLKSLSNKGNYTMYAKMTNPYIIDGEGKNWNDITYYEVLDADLKRFYPNGLWRRGTTRDVALYAKTQGFDGVVIKNITDNGGRNYNVGMDETADIYMLFDESHAKSADPVTYDDNGNVIPLSQRFNPLKDDIRFSMPAGNKKTADEAVAGVFDAKVGTKTNIATQEDIDKYVDYAYLYAEEKKKDENAPIKKQKSGIIIGKADKDLVEEIKSVYGVDLSGAYHVLNDNDIRHIKNSHGEETSEKYPVTAADQKKIPEIIKNYDDVLYVVSKGGKKGLYYVKRHNGVTYYLEALLDGGKTLSNKQMIKVSTGTIPDIAELKDAINKKWNIYSAQNDTNIPLMYVQDVKNNVPNTNVSQAEEVVKRDDLSSEAKLSMPAPTSRAEYEDRAYKLERDMRTAIEEKLGNTLSDDSVKAVQGLADSVAKGDEAKAKAWREVLRDSILKNDMVYYGETDASDDVLSQYFKSMRKRGSRVLVEKEDSQDLTARELSGIFGVGGWSRTAGIGVDVVYEELVNMGARLNDADSVQDRLIAIKEARDAIRSKEKTPMLTKGNVTELIDRAERGAVGAVSEVERARENTPQNNPSVSEADSSLYTREPISQANVAATIAHLNEMFDAIEEATDDVQKVMLEDEYRAEQLKFFEWILPHFTKANERGVTGDFCFYTDAELEAERSEVAESQRAAREADDYMNANNMTRNMVVAAHLMSEGELTEEELGAKWRNVEDREKIRNLSELYKKVTASPEKLKRRHKQLFNDVLKHLFYYSEQMRNISQANIQFDTPERIIDKVCRVNQLRDAGKHGVTGDKSDDYFILLSDTIKDILIRGKDRNEAELKRAAEKYRKIVKDLKIKAGSEESALVQDYGEGRISELDIPFDKREKVTHAAKVLTEEVYRPLLEEANKRRFIEGKGEFVAPPLTLTESERRSFQYMLDNEHWVREHMAQVKDKIKAVGVTKAAESLHLNRGVVQAVSDHGDQFVRYVKWVKGDWIAEDRVPILQQAWNLVQRGKKYNPRSGKVEMDYFPHFEKDDAITELGNLFIDQLPTAINGLTESFRPNSKYNPYFNARTGNKTDSDAIFGADAYINAALQYVYHTSDITKARMAENHIREKYGKDSKNPYVLSNFVFWLREWGNQMAGKQHSVDRMMQNLIGRRASKVWRKGMGNIGRNQISWNIRTPFSNFSVWTRGLAVVGRELTAEGGGSGLGYVFGGWKEHINKSDFLYSRFYDNVDLSTKDASRRVLGNGFKEGAMNAATNVINTVSNAGKTVSDAGFKLMGWSDLFTITAMHKMLTGVYIAQGMSEEDAIRKADYEMKSQAASRDFGDAPLIFSSQTLRPFTMFQVEALNQLAYGRDVIANVVKNPKTARYIVATLLGLALEALLVSLFNNLMKWLTGSPVMLDTVGITIDSVEGMMNGKGFDEVSHDVMEEIPIINNVMKAANGEMSEMIGIGAAVSIVNNIVAAANPNEKVNWAELLYNAGLLVNPFGGMAQAKKTYQAIQLLNAGYSETSKGQVRYAVDGDARDIIAGLLFGKSAMPSVQEWWDSGYKKLSKNNSDAFKQVLDLYDVEPEEAFDMMMEFQELCSEARKADSSYSSYEWVTEELDKWNDGKWNTYDKYFISCLIDDREATIPARMEHPEKIMAEMFIRTGDSGYLMQNAPDTFDVVSTGVKTVCTMSEEQQELYQSKYQEVLFSEINKWAAGKGIDAVWSEEQWKDNINKSKRVARESAAGYCLENGHYETKYEEEIPAEIDTFESLKNNDELTDAERFDFYLKAEGKDYVVYDESYASGWDVMVGAFMVEGNTAMLPPEKKRTFSEKKREYTLNDEQYAKFVEYYNEAFYDGLAGMKDFTYEQIISGMAKLKTAAHNEAKGRIMAEYEGEILVKDKQ